jgi:hypothetical protein
MASLPDTRRRLGIRRLTHGNIKRGQERFAATGKRKLLEVEFSGFLQICNRFLNGLPLTDSANLWTLGNVQILFPMQDSRQRECCHAHQPFRFKPSAICRHSITQICARSNLNRSYCATSPAHSIAFLLTCNHQISSNRAVKQKGTCQLRPSILLLTRKKYACHDDPKDFAYVIQVKENALELLWRALSRAPVDLVGTGDYQAAENKFGLSRKILQVCHRFARLRAGAADGALGAAHRETVCGDPLA